MFSSHLRRHVLHQSGRGSTMRLFCRTQFGGPPALRSYPVYTVYGEECLMSVKILMPRFKVIDNNNLALEKKGRILLEWVARLADGSVDRDKRVAMGLSPEEVGLIINQLPEHEVMLMRQAPSTLDSSTAADDAPTKVFRVTPGDGGTVSFHVDFEKDGVGGQAPSQENIATGPLEVIAQLGEVEVMREIMRSSITTISGWSTTLDIAKQTQIHYALNPRPPSFQKTGTRNDMLF